MFMYFTFLADGVAFILILDERSLHVVLDGSATRRHFEDKPSCFL